MESFYVKCSVNPRAGMETVYDDKPEKDGGGVKVAVIGAGPAGMQAASVLGERGFNVTLYEKKDRCGGEMYQAGLTAPYKNKIQWLTETMKKEAEAAGVVFKMNVEATPGIVKADGAEAVFLACGAEPIVPGLPGIDNKKVILAGSVIEGKVKVSGKVVVIGGGLTGLETAEYIGREGGTESITVVDMLPELGQGMYVSVFMDVMAQLQPYNPVLMPGYKIAAVTESGVDLIKIEDGTHVSVKADYVIIAMGVKPDKDVVDAYEKVFDRVVVLGQAKQAPGRIATSIKSAYTEAYGFNPTV